MLWDGVEGFRLRSLEVGRGRSRSGQESGHCLDVQRDLEALWSIEVRAGKWPFFGRPEGVGSSEFYQKLFWRWGAPSSFSIQAEHEKGRVSPCNANNYLSRCFPEVAGVGTNTVSFIARRPEGVRS